MSKILKILLVEDNDLFRSTIKKSLLKKPCEVIEVSNGREAKEALLLHNFDLVISDIQMPHFSGLDLLEWINKNKPLPVILMTGFSQALETRKADELGASGFLAKPFKEADLFAILTKYIDQVPEVSKTIENIDEQFCKISVDNFLSEKETLCNLYIRISSNKYIKIAHLGGKISDDRIHAYKEKGIHYIFVKKEDFSKILKFNLQVAKLTSKSQTICLEKKINFMKHAGELILQEIFINDLDKEHFSETKNFIESSLEVLTQDDKIFTLLESLGHHSDLFYAHCLGVSFFSVMIARKLGWTSNQTLFKLALGGLFHDIGKKEIDKDILDKPRPLLTLNERKIIESHPKRGKEILEEIETIPSEVATIAYQHHEDPMGQGYPMGLTKRELHPFTKVVQVANSFCEYAIKYRSNVEPVSGPIAILTMDKLKNDYLDKEAFEALKKLFKT